jgi:hypothetical protein
MYNCTCFFYYKRLLKNDNKLKKPLTKHIESHIRTSRESVSAFCFDLPPLPPALAKVQPRSVVLNVICPEKRAQLLYWVILAQNKIVYFVKSCTFPESVGCHGLFKATGLSTEL